jgi:hypothetical protein
MKADLPILTLLVTAAATAAAQSTVTTTGGTSGTVPVFSGTTTVGNSSISQSGSNVGIGTTSPGVKLDVAGTTRATGDVIPGGNGVLRSIVPLAMNGGDAWITASTWQRVTRTTFTSIAGLFAGTAVLPGATRQYYLIIRRADNVSNTTNAIGSSWRFACDQNWNGGGLPDLPGHGFSLTENWGPRDDGSIDWVQIPPTAVSQGCPALAQQYWKIDALQPNTGQTRVMSVSMAAVDVYGGTTIAYSQAGSGNDSYPSVNSLNDNIWSTGPLGSGYVGIGTPTPGSALEVLGNVTLTQGQGGSIIYQDGSVQSVAWNGVLQGGDYAESVDVSGDRAQYAPGDVLVVDPSSEGRFLKSSQPYSTAVMGIYSTHPGVVGRRQKSDRSHMAEEVPMAMIGVVPTKVTAEGGPIKPGDLLVTSSTPGYAMRGTDRSQMMGAVIAKALGHLDSGVGVIEVVVTLQ